MANSGRIAVAAVWALLLLVLAAGLLMRRDLVGDGLGLRRFQTPELVDGDRVAQSFRMDADGLRSVEFRAVPAGDRPAGIVVFELARLGDNKTVVRRGEAAVADVVRSGRYRFSFDPIEESLQRFYSFEIEVAGSAPGHGIILRATRGERLREGEFLFNGERRWATLAFQTDADVTSPWNMLATAGWNPLEPPMLKMVVVIGFASVWLLLGFLLRALATPIDSSDDDRVKP